MSTRRILILILAIFVLVGCGDDASSANDSTLNVSEPDAGEEDPGEISDADSEPEPDADSEPEADPDPQSCESNADCTEDGEYCDRPSGCNIPGSCEEIPDEDCGEAETPYCDCEGNIQTWPNTCVWAPSQELENCEEDEPKEGCELNEDCPNIGQYCERDPGCGDLGECVDIPFGEACSDVITPYCDCEGNAQESSNSCIYDPYMELGSCSM